MRDWIPDDIKPDHEWAYVSLLTFIIGGVLVLLGEEMVVYGTIVLLIATLWTVWAAVTRPRKP